VASRFDLRGRVAIVTGGAGLYGRPIGEAFGEAGAHVVVASRDLDACSAFADELVTAGFEASACRVDLADEGSIRALRADVVGRLGAIDVLVNGSVHRTGGDLLETTAADWEATSRVNSLGTFLITREIAQQMIEQGSGSIVNIASIYGMVGPDFSIYDETAMTMPAFYAFDKGGLVNFTRYLATRLAPHGVRANCLSPGGLGTDDQPRPFVEAYTSRVPLGRLATAHDIKGPVVFLASDASAYVTGVNLPVDGGWTAR
jgi:NAD(P)-dependent dehydrogenase (short-subunit alcohol dehydrogenase family)